MGGSWAFDFVRFWDFGHEKSPGPGSRGFLV